MFGKVTKTVFFCLCCNPHFWIVRSNSSCTKPLFPASRSSPALPAQPTPSYGSIILNSKPVWKPDLYLQYGWYLPGFPF